MFKEKFSPAVASYRILIFVLLTTGLFLSGCCEDDDECAGQESVTVDFITGVNFDEDSSPDILPIDTFREGTFIEFQASSEDLELYSWRLQNDPQVFTGDYQRILFDEGTAGTVEVTLIGDARTALINNCLSEEELVDSLTKSITIIPVDACAIIGRYRGYRTSDPDNVFEVEIKLRDNSSSFYELTNFPDGCNRIGTIAPIRTFIHHRYFEMTQFGVTTDDDCPRPSGFGVLDEDHNILTIDFEIYVRETNATLSDRFIATKIE